MLKLNTILQFQHYSIHCKRELSALHLRIHLILSLFPVSSLLDFPFFANLLRPAHLPATWGSLNIIPLKGIPNNIPVLWFIPGHILWYHLTIITNVSVSYKCFLFVPSLSYGPLLSNDLIGNCHVVYGIITTVNIPSISVSNYILFHSYPLNTMLILWNWPSKKQISLQAGCLQCAPFRCSLPHGTAPLPWWRRRRRNHRATWQADGAAQTRGEMGVSLCALTCPRKAQAWKSKTKHIIYIYTYVLLCAYSCMHIYIYIHKQQFSYVSV